jgi:hypothetical protein
MCVLFEGGGWEVRPLVAGATAEGICACRRREHCRSRGGLKRLAQRRAPGGQEVDLRGVAGDGAVTQGSQFARLGLDLGQAARIGFDGVQCPGRCFGSMG